MSDKEREEFLKRVRVEKKPKRKVRNCIKNIGKVILYSAIVGGLGKMYYDSIQIDREQRAIEDKYKEKIAEASGVTKDKVKIWVDFSQDGNGDTALTNNEVYITGNDGERYIIDHLDEDSHRVLEMAYGIGGRPSIKKLKEMEKEIDNSKCTVNIEDGEIELSFEQENEIDERE